MKKNIGSVVFILILLFAILLVYNKCSVKNIFHTKTNREAYIDHLKKQNEKIAFQWDSLADASLIHPFEINFPYAEKGMFNNFNASALQFTSTPGRLINIDITNLGKKKIFADLIEVDSSENKIIIQADTNKTTLQYASYFGGNYILRLQPQIADTGKYEITIKSLPLLQWPIEDGVKAQIGSFWGADRDGGNRSHEGIDIFAPKGTYLVAVKDGIIHRVGQNNLGGNIIFMQPHNMPISVYYAHLDTQLVQEGASVKTGDTIATVGNTGNARTTAPHLHLGIYARPKGAINPIGYISKKQEADLTSNSLPNNHIIISKSKRLYKRANTKSLTETIVQGDSIHILGLTENYYRVRTSSGMNGFIQIKDL